jgi:hypothetical protein
MQGHKGPKECVWECKRLSVMTFKCTFILEVIFMQKSQMFRALVFFKKSSKLGLQNTIGKILKYRCLNCPRIIHLDLKCMSYDRKKGQSQFDSWSQIAFEQGSNHVQLGCAIHHWKDDFECYKILFCLFQKDLIWRKYVCFKTIKVLILTLPPGSFKENATWM